MINNLKLFYFLLLVTFLYSVPCISQINMQEVEEPIFTKSFFNTDDPLSINLTFDLKSFRRTKPDTFYIPAIISFKNDVMISKEIRIKARGSFRKDYCTFPSYWLNFKKTTLIEDSVYNTKKIKIVSHCKESEIYSINLLKEYIAYKLYNIINENSFRVRLLIINYSDESLKKRDLNRWAIMIEPESFLAERIDAYPLQMNNKKYAHLDSVNAVMMAFFQYMIGNTDFNIGNRHNIKLFISKDHKKEGIIAIPYDFDYSGLVYAKYAIPSSKIHIMSVRERFYYGACRSNKIYDMVIEHYKSKEQEIIEFISSFEYISKRDRKSMLNYIERFYNKIGDKKFIEKEIRPFCIESKAILKLN